MDRSALHRITVPTAWAGPPKAFSFSSLKKMDVCLRQWQLGRSTYGDLGSYPEAPSEPAEAGTVVHDLLSRLFHAMAVAGYPAIGSDAFHRVILEVDIVGTARRRLQAFAERAVDSPRAARFRPKVTARDIYNHVAQAFREEYARILLEAPNLLPIPKVVAAVSPARTGGASPRPVTVPAERLRLLEQLGVLSEEDVRHPTLPLLGFIDLLVRRENRTTVLDFKTGAARAEYRDQLLLYALMWWRSTGDMPVHIELRYGARVEGWPVLEADLVSVEERIAAKISQRSLVLAAGPAPATLGPHCGSCEYRQLCDDYWKGHVEAGARSGSWVDCEVMVKVASARTSFVAEDATGREVTVVFDEDIGALWGPFLAAEKLRIIGAGREGDEEALRLTSSTEVFRVVS